MADSELESSLAALSVADDVLRSPPPPLVVRTPSEVEEAAVAGRRRSASGRDDFDFQTPSSAADLPYRPSPTGSSAATSARVGSGSRGSARWQASSRKPLSAHTGEPRSGGGRSAGDADAAGDVAESGEHGPREGRSFAWQVRCAPGAWSNKQPVDSRRSDCPLH